MKRILKCITVFLLLSGFFNVSAVYSGGQVEGSIKFIGNIPKQKKVEVKKDSEVCGKNSKFSESLILSQDRGIKNAVISIEGTGKKAKPASVTIKLDQKGCRFEPHLTVVPVGSKVDLINSDAIMHNIHTYTIKNDSINFSQPALQKVRSLGADFFMFSEIIPVRCDVHNWMSAYMVVTNNPHTTVSDKEGFFKFIDVPPGDYTISVWHEFLGKVSKKITVSNGKNFISFDLQKKKRRKR